MTIGERIKTLREQHRMTLEDVAEHLNIGRSTVFRYENGTVTNIPSDKIELLSELFNVSPAYLMGWSDDQEGTSASVPIIVPNSEQFVNLVHYMSAADYQMVMAAYDRAYKKMKEKNND